MTSEIPEENRNASGESQSQRDSDSERRSRERAASDETSESGDDVPLNIAGHEDRKRKREEAGDGEAEFGPDDAPEATTDADDADRHDADAVLADDLAPAGDDEEVEPVELLVQLAEEGEIEPWDIDIVAVTDKFLDRLDESDLRTSGRALFYASVLLRMKSDALLADDEDDEPEPEPWEVPMAMEAGADDGFDPVDSLEQEMERRLDRKHARGTPETLEELVRDLRERERGSWWKESRTYDTSDSPQGFQRGTQTLDYRSADDMRMDEEPTEDEVTGTTHDEDMESVIEDVRAELETQYGRGRTEVLYDEIEDIGPTRVETYLALLFLAHRGYLTLDQDDLFGDLWVQNADVVEESEEEEEPAELLAD